MEIVAPEVVRADVPDVGPGLGDPGDRDPEIPEGAERALVVLDGDRPAAPPFVVVAEAPDLHVGEPHVVLVRRTAGHALKHVPLRGGPGLGGPIPFRASQGERRRGRKGRGGQCRTSA